MDDDGEHLACRRGARRGVHRTQAVEPSRRPVRQGVFERRVDTDHAEWLCRRVESVETQGGIVSHLRDRAAERVVLDGIQRLAEMGLTATRFGRTSLTMRAEVRNMITRQSILTIEEIVFVNLDPHGKPAPHGYTEITYDRDRIPTHHLTETLEED